MTRQYALDIALPVAYAPEQFIRSASNSVAFDWIERWPDWPDNALLLVGERGSGKTHLAHLWKRKTNASFLPPDDETLPAGAIIVDGLETWKKETALFHLFNHAKLNGHPLLFTASAMPKFALPDLASRIKSLPAAEISPPDEALLSAVLMKHFSDRQLKISPEVVDYMLPRLPRSFEGLSALVARLDDASLEESRTLTIPFVRSYL